MTKLAELASLIRSKNAGPFELTMDIMFDDPEVYRRVKGSRVVNRDMIAAMYNVAREHVRFFESDSALAIKVSIPRPVFQGDVGDTDGHGGQQYGPLMDVEVP